MVLGSAANDALAVMSSLAIADEAAANGAEPAQVPAFHAISVTAIQTFGQMFQVGSAPLLNALLYTNSPKLLAVDQLFLALARRSDLPENDLTSLTWDIAGMDLSRQAAEQQGDLSAINDRHWPANHPRRTAV